MIVLIGESGARYALGAQPEASGGEAVVYRARAEEDGRDVAVKVSLAGGADAERLLAQASRMRALSSHPEAGPWLAPVWDVGRWDDRAFLVMDWTPRTLAHVLGLPPAERVRWVLRLLDAVEALGRAGVVHGDVKPSNVLIAGDPGDETLLLVDPVDFAEGRFTPGHAPPEQIRGGPASVGWDRYAAAVAAWQLLAREAPTGPLLHLSGDTRLAVVEADRVSMEQGLPACGAVRAALEACLRPDPAERPPDLAALRAALAAWPGRPVAATEATRAPERQVVSRPGAAFVALGAPILVVALTMGLATADPTPFCPEGTARSGSRCLTPDGLAFVRVPRGTYLQGRSDRDPERSVPDAPTRRVTISRPFLLGVNEVTQREWTALTGKNPVVGGEMFADPVHPLPCDVYQGVSLVGDELPVMCVTWYDVIEWLNARSAADGLQPAYRIEPPPLGGDPVVTWDREADGWRLPTEAEWEYAARAGSRGRFGPSDDIPTICHHANLRDQSALEKWGNELPCPDGFPTLAPAGSYPANAWGLHDMHGNVIEWVWDRYGPYEPGPVVDPVGAVDGELRLLRGSSWNHVTRGLAGRYPSEPDGGAWSIGFRIARNAP